MQSKKTLIIFTVIFILILAGASTLYNSLSKVVEPQGGGLSAQNYNEIVENNEQTNEIEDEKETEQVDAPDFTVVDSEGNEVHLSDFIGKPVILNFWASWCGPCKMEMPDFNEIYNEKGEEIHFLMVNLTDGSRETIDTAKSFIEEQGYTFPVYYDTSSDAAMKYGVNSIPSTYFIDAEGHAIAQAKGAIDTATIQAGIDMITEE